VNLFHRIKFWRKNICSFRRNSQEKDRVVEILCGEFAKSREPLDLAEEQGELW
jgi:hypothetical protein